MLQILANRTYRHLLAAQVIALIGTGLATVALGLLAYDLAGADAGAVLGTALAIKMIAYVGVAPVAAAFTERLPRRTMLVSLDLIRASVAILLPFVTDIWQVYLLIFILQAASAAFTPTFQATIPDILPDEKDYTKALSLSRLAYDLESVASPMLAAALLTLVSFHNLFAGTVIGFLASAMLVVSVALPSPKAAEQRGIYDRTTRGLRIYLATPRLRGLLTLNLAVAAASVSLTLLNVPLIWISIEDRGSQTPGSSGRFPSKFCSSLACARYGHMVGQETFPISAHTLYETLGTARAPILIDVRRGARVRRSRCIDCFGHPPPR